MSNHNAIWNLSGTDDPSLVATPAPIGAQYARTDTGQIYMKTGPGDTAWTPSASATSIAVIFDDAVPADRVNIRSDRASNQSPIDNTKIQITNLGSQDLAINPAATGATGNGATIGGGDDNTASGDYSTVPGGSGNTASGANSHASGFLSTASGSSAHAEGASAQATATGAHAEGISTTASGNGAHAEGNSSTASGVESHAEGCNTTASAHGAHAEGTATQATGGQAHAEGRSTQATANNAHAEGYNSIASRSGQHAHSSGPGGLDDGTAGYTQQSVITMAGFIDGLAPGETVELTSGDATAFFELEDDHAYAIVVTAIAYASGATLQSFRQMFAVRRTAGVTTIEATGVLEQIGSVLAASWSLVASVGAAPDRFALTFSTGATTYKTRITAKVEFVEIVLAAA